MDRVLYDQVVNACLPELRHEIRKLDGRTGRALRRKAERELSVSNIESMARCSIDESIEKSDEIRKINKKTSELGKMILDLFMRGYKYGEIAEIMDITEDAVDNNLRKIRKTLRKHA